MYNINYSRKAEPLGDIRRSLCEELDAGRLCNSVVRAADRESEDLGSNPSTVESVFFSTERFSNSLILLIFIKKKNKGFFTMNFNPQIIRQSMSQF